MWKAGSSYASWVVPNNIQHTIHEPWEKWVKVSQALPKGELVCAILRRCPPKKSHGSRHKLILVRCPKDAQKYCGTLRNLGASCPQLTICAPIPEGRLHHFPTVKLVYLPKDVSVEVSDIVEDADLQQKASKASCSCPEFSRSMKNQ